MPVRLLTGSGSAVWGLQQGGVVFRKALQLAETHNRTQPRARCVPVVHRALAACVECGSRRLASSKTCPITAGMLSVTEAVSHLPSATGPRRRFGGLRS